MKDVLQKFGLTEFFAYLCPGVVLFCSSAIWLAEEFDQVLEGSLEKHPLVVVFILLVISYTLGLIVGVWANDGASRYVREYLYQTATLANPKFVKRVRLRLLGFLHKIPIPKDTRPIVASKLRIEGDLLRFGLPELSDRQSPWDLLQIYRAIVKNRLGDSAASILEEAEVIHRRLLFALGVALALLLVALQLAVPIVRDCLAVVLASRAFGEGGLLACVESHLAVTILALLGFVASVVLRRVAGHMWENELLLTSSLTLIEPPEASGQEAEESSSAKASS